ncbi:MAG: nucleotide exchange factor GrpE [Clostridia bacterium]|nr:nucleotide exchange factor GrpE [Clostridia bacterium]
MENEKNTTPAPEETAAQDVAQETAESPAAEPDKKAKKQAKVADLEAKLEAAETELAAVKDQYQRMLAEYANYKRRTEQEKEQIGAFTKAELLTGLLTSVDNMEKAIAAPATGDYKTGVDLVLRQFLEALQKLGLEAVGVEGEPFDPNVHNAVMREDADGVEPDTVTAVFQKGYKLGDRVLRPAMVKVAN